MTPTGPMWWYVARASGIVAWALVATSVLWGQALATRALGQRPKAPWLLDLHRFLGALSVVFTVVHLGGLVADSYVHFGLADLFVPMASGWRPGGVAWGIVSLYMLLAIQITSLLMRRLPKRWWKLVHRSSFGLFVFSTVHLFTAGSDASVVPLRWSALLTSAAVVFFTVYRMLAPRRRAAAPAAAAARARAAA